MNARNDSFYDLSAARRLTRRLSAVGSDALAADDASAPRPAYAPLAGRFSPLTAAPAAPTLAPMPAPAEAPAVPTLEDADLNSWEDLVVWARKIARARTAFIVDSQGFIIAVSGETPDLDREGMGAEFCYSFEVLERIDPRAGRLRWVEFDFDRRRIAGYRLLADSGADFALAMVDGERLDLPLRDAVTRKLDAVFRALS